MRPGDPPDGQRLLGEAFGAYCEARCQNNTKESTELILLANLQAGFHEQIRLQPEIYAALNAPSAETAELKRRLLAAVLPGLWIRNRYRFTHLLSGMLPLHGALDRLVQEVNQLIRQVITAHLMTLHLSGGEVLRLGQDVPTPFPQALEQVCNPKLRELLVQTDMTPDSPSESGALDWADFKERMHFITDFFRAYQERRLLFEPPFTPEQVVIVKAGKQPNGDL